jgi:hypothetical protein
MYIIEHSNFDYFYELDKLLDLIDKEVVIVKGTQKFSKLIFTLLIN